MVAENPERLVPIPFDVRDGAAIGAAVAGFLARQGPIDGWVNNAGVKPSGPSARHRGRGGSASRWRSTCSASLLCARAVLPSMIERRRGVILNVSSVAATRPVRGQSVYAATKGGLESLTRALAVEYGRKGVRVHGIRPGPIDTGMLAPTRAVAGDDAVLDRTALRRLGRAGGGGLAGRLPS